MKLAMLGTGMIVMDLLSTIDKLDIEKKVIFGTRRSADKVEKIKQDYHCDAAYFDYDELLQSDIDTVYVGLPNMLHYEYTKKALEAGKNDICEKPLCSNYKEFCELEKLAKEKELILVEAVTIHYMPAYLSLKEKIKDLGDIKIVSANYSQYSSRYDAFKEGTILPAFDVHKSGGALMDLNVYNVNFIVGLFGAPKSVTYLPNIEKGIDTSGILLMDYGTFKAVAIGAKDCMAPVMTSIQGDKANLVVNRPVNRFRKYTYTENRKEGTEFEFDENTHAMYYEFKEFIDMIDNHDLDRAYKMLEISGITAKILNDARNSAGIVFDADLQ